MSQSFPFRGAGRTAEQLLSGNRLLRYTDRVTQQDAIAHWRKGAESALKMAKVAQREGEHESALFHCHLAVEKALKAVYMKQHREEHPHTHDLAYLAGLVEHSLGTAEVESLKQLSEFVVDARYSDPYWAAEQATNDAAIHWIGVTERLLSLLLHEI